MPPRAKVKRAAKYTGITAVLLALIGSPLLSSWGNSKSDSKLTAEIASLKTEIEVGKADRAALHTGQEQIIKELVEIKRNHHEDMQQIIRVLAGRISRPDLTVR